MRDLMRALQTLCLSRSGITDFVEDRIFINQIPRATVKAQDPEEPQKVLVLRQAGGAGKADTLAVVNRTFDALCYGETDYEADRLLRVVTKELILMEREEHNDALIHHVNTTGGPLPSVEEDLGWPAVAQSFTTLAGLLEVT